MLKSLFRRKTFMVGRFKTSVNNHVKKNGSIYRSAVKRKYIFANTLLKSEKRKTVTIF